MAVQDTFWYARTVGRARWFPSQALLAPLGLCVCIVRITRLMPGVHQPDPPGLIHDDLRLLPPWRGSSLLWGVFVGRIGGELRLGCGISFSLSVLKHVLSTVSSLYTTGFAPLAFAQ